MSQKVTLDVALTLKRGDILYHNILEFGGLGEEKTPATARVTGKCRILKGGVEKFSLPIRRLYCGGSDGAITRMSQDIWRTEPEKKALPGRVHRVRPAPTPEPVTPARVRLRRVRSCFNT